MAPQHDVAKPKADSTLRYSQAVPDPNTNRALSHLTSEVRRDPVHSTRYGRQQMSICDIHCLTLLSSSCWAHSPLLGQHVSSKEAGRTTLSGPHSKSASSVAATYKPPMLVPRVRLPAGAFHVCARGCRNGMRPMLASAQWNMTSAGLKPAIPGSMGRCLIHWATRPSDSLVSPHTQPHALTHRTTLMGGAEEHVPFRADLLLDSLRRSSVKVGTIQRRLAWPLRKDDTQKSKSVSIFCPF